MLDIGLPDPRQTFAGNEPNDAEKTGLNVFRKRIECRFHGVIQKCNDPSHSSKIPFLQYNAITMYIQAPVPEPAESP